MGGRMALSLLLWCFRWPRRSHLRWVFKRQFT